MWSYYHRHLNPTVYEITDTTPDNMNSLTTESDSIYFHPWVKPQGYENIGNDH